MNKMKLYFDFRDVFRAPRLALSGKKIWVHLVGLFIGWGFYFILTYLAQLVSGNSITWTWNKYKLFPCIFGDGLSWISWVIYVIGFLGWLFVWFQASAAVSRITYKQLKGDEFYSSGDSFKYLKKHWVAVVMGPISVLLIAAFFIVMAIIAAWIAKWPVLDIIFFGLPYLLYIFVSTFVVYTFVVFVVSIILSPYIVGTAEEDTMETVFQSYSTLWSQPWRLVTYEGLLGVLTYVGAIVFAWAAFYGYKLIEIVFGLPYLMADKVVRILSVASSYILGSNSPITDFIANISFNSSLLFLGEPLARLTTTETITTVLVTIFLFVVAGVVVSYLFSIWSVGQTIIYVILRKKKDDEDLIERKDEEEMEEEEEEDEFKFDEDEEEKEKEEEQESDSGSETKAEEETGEEKEEKPDSENKD